MAYEKIYYTKDKTVYTILKRRIEMYNLSGEYIG